MKYQNLKTEVKDMGSQIKELNREHHPKWHGIVGGT
jgi:hypothetical protein